MKKYSLPLGLLLLALIIVPTVSFGQNCNVNSLAPAQYRQNGENVKNMQVCLQQLGYKISQATGYYGQETLKAVKSYYSSWYGTWPGLRLGILGINKIINAFKNIDIPVTDFTPTVFGLKQFTSEAEYTKYIKDSAGSNVYYGGPMINVTMPTTGMMMKESAPTLAPSMSVDTTSRYSSTNVQVLGIDEPDIAKTDGQNIYYKTESAWVMNLSYMGPPPNTNKISVIKALPVNDLSVIGHIDLTGYGDNNLLLDQKTLVSLGSNNLKGYNVSDPKNPTEKWSMDLQDNNQIVTSRLYNGKLYLVAKTYINEYKTCSFNVLKSNNQNIAVRCIDIYHPVMPMPVDATFTAMTIDINTGKVLNTLSFLGSANTSTIYMSENNLYVTYNYYDDPLRYYINFMKEKTTDLVSVDLINKLEKISGYDLSNQTKWTEYQTEINKYYDSLSADNRLKIQNEFNNRLSDYTKLHYRDLEKTAIVKVGLDNLKVAGTGNVPGKLLNQFSLDEYQGNLRVAVTIGGDWNMFSMNRNDSISDVYILNSSLNVMGSVKGLGATEKIYSVRFLANRGYLVTFRQTDPFYVLDLSNPWAPVLKGELRIPGYSAYLHPISDTVILGIGRENNQVKISLFDVSSPSNPTELSKYNLNDSWTEIESNHHAFLLDKKHGVFFVPASQGGYIFSYQNNKLSLVKAVSGYSVKRALYINDYLYILGDNKITVLDEYSWNTVKELSL